MKKIYLLFLTIPLILIGQSWKYETITNDFDGTFKVASQIANRTSSVYDPTLVLNSKGDGLIINFYITGFGLAFDDLSVWLKFDNDENTYYAKTSLSDSGKTIFIINARDNNDIIISKIELLSKLTRASRLSLRIQDKYDKDDYSFSLLGSSKAINHVVNVKGEMAKLKIGRKLKRDTDLKVENFMTVIRNLKLGLSSWKWIQEVFKTDFRTAIINGTQDNYQSIVLKEHPLEKYKRQYQVKIFYIMKDSTEKAISDSYYRVEKTAPIYKRFLDEENKIKKEKERLAKELDKKINTIIDKINFKDISYSEVKKNIETRNKFNRTEWTYDSLYVKSCECGLFESLGKVNLYFSRVSKDGFRENHRVLGDWYVKPDAPIKNFNQN
jgi:hypothetical protein